MLRKVLRKTNPFHSIIFQKWTSRVGLIILVGILGVCVGGSVLTPYHPTSGSLQINEAPSYSHIFGTDWIGHDLFSQVTWGAYVSLYIAILGALGSVILGAVVGVSAGYFDRLRGVLSGASDVIMVFPALPLLILIGSLIPPTNLTIALLLLLVMWPVVARVIRNQAASVKKLVYVDAAKTSGYNDRQILFGIIIPEVAPLAIAYFIINVALAVVITTALEFLGVANPSVVSWGSILFYAQNYAFLAGDWWWVLFPGLFITLSAIAFALIGFSIEEVANPRLRG